MAVFPLSATAACGLIICVSLDLLAQGAAPAAKYPTIPRPLPEAEEHALALSAAPVEVSVNADVYVLRTDGYARVRAGTNGISCMVAREYHAGSLYPLCFDQEATRTILPRYLKEGALRLQGVPEARIDSLMEGEIRSGRLPRPTKPAIAYMMSPRQVIFSSPGSDGRRVGSWHPHVMLVGTGITSAQAGFSANSRYQYVQAGGPAGSIHELVFLLPVWSDGRSASTRD